MAIEITDLNVLNRMRDGRPKGKTCAILGDCHVYGQSLEEFKNVDNVVVRINMAHVKDKTELKKFVNTVSPPFCPGLGPPDPPLPIAPIE